jgi:hypothetical protein
MAPSHAPGSVDRSLLQCFFQQLQNDHGTRADEPLVSGQLILESVQLRFLRRRQPLVVLLVDQDATSGVPAVIPTARRRGTLSVQLGPRGGRTGPLPPLPGCGQCRPARRTAPQLPGLQCPRFPGRSHPAHPRQGRTPRPLLRLVLASPARPAGQVGQSEAVSDSDSNAEEITIDRSAVNAQKSAADGPRAGSLSTWAMLIQRVYEVDPLACPHCGAAMKIVSFIECRQRDVIERILRHCGLWEGPLRTLASARGPPGRTPQVPDEPRDLELVLDPEFAWRPRRPVRHASVPRAAVGTRPGVPVRPTSGPDRRDFF